MIGKIWKHEVDSSKNLSPGDSWGIFSSQRNPSYFCTGALELFKRADSSDWDKVTANSYAILMKVRNAATGLVPDLCSSSGQVTQPVFKYDAIRTPWRMAWAYFWYGHDTAKTVCSTIASWITAKTGGDLAKIGDGYNLDGTQTSQYNNGTFVGCFASAGMVDAQHQTWLDAAYKRLDSLVAMKEVYFSQSLKLLNLLLMSGNMPNFWNMPVAIASPKISSDAGKAPAIPEISFVSHGGILNVVAAPGAFRVDICNSLGQRVVEPYSGLAGNHRVSLPIGKHLQYGVYWAHLKTAAGSATARIIVTQ